MSRANKNILIVIGGLAVIVVVFMLGLLIGKNQGRSATIQSLGPTINALYPPPAAVIHNLTGKILNIAGATITLQVPDPNDYLPHADNSPRATQNRYAVVTKDTIIKLLNYKKLDNRGLPQITILKLTDLKTGETIIVQSAANIKDARQFDATEIDLLQS